MPSGEVQALLALRRVAETFLLQEAVLPDADYRAAFRGQPSLPHALFNKSTFGEALGRALERVFQSPIEANVVVAQGFQFLHGCGSLRSPSLDRPQPRAA